MRKLAAHYVIPGDGRILKYGIVQLDNENKVVKIIDTKGKFEETAGTEFYSGVIIPGFVNTHCHIELSHTKGKIPTKTGISEFVKQVITLPKEDTSIQENAMKKAIIEMTKNGIVAVGDISNSNVSFALKSQSKLQFHTFIEALGFNPKRADEAFNSCIALQEKAISLGIKSSIVPHAPYSISTKLFNKINTKSDQDILSIHNQESKGENDLFLNKQGAIKDHLEQNLKMNLSFFAPTGKSSVKSFLPLIDANKQLLLVHNIHTSEEDIDFILSCRSNNNTYFVLCPKSNIYIEDTLPPVHLFIEKELKLCIGTDSLASNSSLSIIEELLILQNKFNLQLDKLIEIACVNGADALKLSKDYGSITPGKKCGINLLSGLDLKQLKLTENTVVKRLV